RDRHDRGAGLVQGRDEVGLRRVVGDAVGGDHDEVPARGRLDGGGDVRLVRRGPGGEGLGGPAARGELLGEDGGGARAPAGDQRVALRLGQRQGAVVGDEGGGQVADVLSGPEVLGAADDLVDLVEVDVRVLEQAQLVLQLQDAPDGPVEAQLG